MIPRWALNSLLSALKEQRIAVVVGPRQCGKTTLVENAHITNSEFISLDIDSNLQSARQDPNFFIAQHRDHCLIIDEIQKAPSLIGEIKYAVDHDERPGQFVLTGSSDYRKLPHANESLAGRVDFIRLRTFSTAEKMGVRPVFLSRIFQNDFVFSIDKETCGKRFALLEAVVGGYPRIFQHSELEPRVRWFQSYLDQQVILDMKEQWSIRRESILTDLFPYLAANSSKLHSVTGMAKQLGQNANTLNNYISVLKAMFIVDEVKAWTKKDYDRPGKATKFFMTDSGLMSHILRQYDVDELLSNNSYEASDFIGKLIETWVYNQLMPEIDLHPLWTIEHYRTPRREIDFIVTNEKGEMLGIEVKASQSVQLGDFKHLTWFGEQAKQSKLKFKGIVLYAGSRVLSFGSGCYAVPFSAMWGDYRA